MLLVALLVTRPGLSPVPIEPPRELVIGEADDDAPDDVPASGERGSGSVTPPDEGRDELSP